MSIFLHRVGLLRPSLPAGPASFVFNGTDAYLSKAISTSSPNLRVYTVSVWAKVANFPDDGFIDSVISAYISAGFYTFHGLDTSGSSNLLFYRINAGATVSQQLTTSDLSTDTWYHIVYRVETTNATAEDRVRMYVAGTLQGDTDTVATPLNQDTQMFNASATTRIGSFSGSSNYFDGKLAFIDVAYGQSLAPTNFAFDDGGTWTRKPFAGSYGTYGFSLDGTDGFNDVSGNGINFTGTNMDTSNLDTGDLPPYTT